MNQPVLMGETRRRYILERGAELFARVGVANAPLSAIAEASGIKKGSLYYFFESKEELLLDVLRPVVEEPTRELRAIVEGPGDVSYRLTEAMAALGRAFGQHPDRMQILVRERLQHHLAPASYEVVRQWKTAYTDLWRQLLREGVSSGVFPPLDDKIVVFGQLGALNWMFAWFDPAGNLTGEEIGRVLAHYALHGLLTPAPGPGSTSGGAPVPGDGPRRT